MPDTEITKQLLILDSKLEQEKLELRKRACEIAEQQRKLRKLITEQDKVELQQAEEVVDQWTVKSMNQLSQEGFLNEDKLDDHLRRLEAK